MARNPKWSRDELILALDLYFKENPSHTSDNNPKIIELSETLNALPVHPKSEHQDKFRNPNGVYMKLCNFLRFDPDYEGAGLTRGGKLEEIIWNEFFDDRLRLQLTANAIKDGMRYVSPPEVEQDIEEEEFIEGRVLTELHKRKERSSAAPKRKKRKVLEEFGKLACEVCGFDFYKTYGSLGEGFAECHHRKPISSLKAEEPTKLKDLAIVCANCHRMIHRSKPWLSVEELTEKIRS